MTLWALWVPTIGLFVAALGFIWNAAALRGVTKTRDLEWLFRFLSDVQKLEAKIVESTTETGRNSAFTEMVNYLEICCFAFNGKLFPKRTSELVERHLINTIATIQSVPLFALRVERLVTTEGTFEDLRKFIAARRNPIAKAQTAIEARDAQGGT